MQSKIQGIPMQEESIHVNVDRLLSFAMESRVSNVRHAIDLALEAEERSKDQEYDLGLATSHDHLGLFYMIIGESELSVKYATLGLEEFQALQNKNGKATCLYTLGSVNYKKGNHHQGLEFLYECLRIQQDIGDLSGQSKTLKAIGYIYEIFQEFDKALETYQRCQKISHLNNDKNGESNACNPMSGLYLKRNDYKNALKAINISISLKQQTGDKRGLAFAWYGKAKIHISLNETEEAKILLKKSLSIHQKVSDHLGMGMALVKLGLLLKKSDSIKAKEYLNRAIIAGQAIGNELILYKAHFQLFEIAMNEGNRNVALDHHIKFHDYKEGVINSETKSKIKSLESMWKMEALENEAKQQRDNNVVMEKQNEELDKFSSRVSHDLRGPISSLVGLYDVVKNEVSDPSAMKYFNLYHKRLKHIDQIIVDLLALTKVKDWEMTRTLIDFDGIVKECIDAFNYLPGFERINFSIDIDQDLSMTSDRILMNTIIQNLIENSIKYASSKVGQPFVNVKVQKSAEDFMCIIVEDNGIGIDERYQGKVFDMFYRASEDVQGSGLGMYILKSAVDKLEGEVSLSSELGKGSKFIVLIPILESLRKEYLGI